MKTIKSELADLDLNAEQDATLEFWFWFAGFVVLMICYFSLVILFWPF